MNDSCVHNTFPTPFTNEVLENVGGQKGYSFSDGLLGYQQIKITLEDQSKTTFAIEWGGFQYTVMPFGLKNSPAIFFRVVVATFKEFIDKFLEVYFDDLTMFGLVKRYVSSIHLMLDTCRKYHISFNLKKCIFFILYVIHLGHVVCKQGLMVDFAKIAVIINLEPPRMSNNCV